MPVLSSGPHLDPKDGACVMEYVSILAGEKFTDAPTCTNTVIGGLAWWVNDSIGDTYRHLLLPLIPRLMQTGEPLHPMEKARLSSAYKEKTREVFTAGFMPTSQKSAKTLVEALGSLIDTYWELRGVPEPEPTGLTADDYTLMRETVTQ